MRRRKLSTKEKKEVEKEEEVVNVRLKSSERKRYKKRRKISDGFSLHQSLEFLQLLLSQVCFVTLFVVRCSLLDLNVTRLVATLTLAVEG